MFTLSELFKIVSDWHYWNGANHRVQELKAQGKSTDAETYRTIRDQCSVDPLQVLHAVYRLTDSLIAARRDIVTEARRRGASWEQIAQRVGCPVDEVYAEFMDKSPQTL